MNMTNVHFTPQFIQDLVTSNDKSFLQRVIKNTFDRNAKFIIGENDHRYHGIEDAWIRYVSRGTTAYRIIYIRKNNNVYLYRAGQHSIEDNLTTPQNLETSIPTSNYDGVTISDKSQSLSTADCGELFVTNRRFEELKLIPDYFQKMFHVGHEEIVLVSPFIDTALLGRYGILGSFLNKQIEEGAVVSLITRPPTKKEELQLFEDLDATGYEIMFISNLHTKLFLFEVRKESLSKYNKEQICKVAILGSSNLTEKGLGFEKNGNCNEELCYRAEDYRYDEFRQYAHRLTIESDDYISYKSNMRRF